MVASPSSAVPGQEPQQIDLAEWLRLRRPPPPDFLKALDRLPPSLLPLVERALPPGKPVRGALLLHAEFFARPKSGWEFVPERVLVFLDDTVILARAAALDKPAQVTVLDAADLLYARSSLVLLYGLLEFKTVSGAQPDEVRLEYNSVIWETFRSSLARFVTAAYSPRATAGDGVRAANAEILKSVPYKFANGVQYNGLTPGERLLAAVFQPEIREGRWIRSRQLTPNTVFALTDQQVVIVEEVLSLALRAQPKGEHGWVFTYIPRNRVTNWSITPGARWAEATLRIEWAGATEERSFVLEPLHASQWQRAWLDAGR
jgi:hypothetical protein